MVAISHALASVNLTVSRQEWHTGTLWLTNPKMGSHLKLPMQGEQKRLPHARQLLRLPLYSMSSQAGHVPQVQFGRGLTETVGIGTASIICWATLGSEDFKQIGAFEEGAMSASSLEAQILWKNPGGFSFIASRSCLLSRREARQGRLTMFDASRAHSSLAGAPGEGGHHSLGSVLLRTLHKIHT